MASLQFRIDSICANFTVDSLNELVKTQLTEGPSTISDIARAIMEKDRSLDSKSAETLAEAAVESLSQGGDVGIQGPCR